MASGAAVALDDPMGESLRGHHADLARRLGRAATCPPGVATFSAVPTDPSPADRADLARLLGRGGFADMFDCPATPPQDRETVFVLEGRQMIWPGSGRPGQGPAAVDGDVVEPGAADVPEILDLVARTQPGPFRPRTLGFASRKPVTFRGFRTPDGSGARVTAVPSPCAGTAAAG